MVDWEYFNKFDSITDKYLPLYDEGDTLATQIVTAVTKLVYRYYNDGDIYDNTGRLAGSDNNLSNYANWLFRYTDAGRILEGVWNCNSENEYQDLLKELADYLLDEELLAIEHTHSKVGSIYDCDGPFVYEDYEEDYEEDYM